MRWISLSVVALLAATPCVSAEECCAAKLKLTQEKVDGLITKWQAASKSLASLPAATKVAMGEEIARVAASCPVGSRLGDTLAFVHRAITATIEAEAAGAKACIGDESADASHATLAASFKARSELMGALGRLTQHASAALGECGSAQQKETATLASSPESTCASKATELAAAIRKESCSKTASTVLASAVPALSCEKARAQLVSEVKSAGCEESAAQLITAALSTCAKKESSVAVTATATTTAASCTANCAEACCQSKQAIASVAGQAACSETLKVRASVLCASWNDAPLEYAALGSERRAELQGAVAAIMTRSAAARLLPETVVTVADGLQMLVDLEAYLLTAVKEDPQLAKGFTGEVARGVEERAVLLRQASEIMSRARTIMQSALKGETTD